MSRKVKILFLVMLVLLMFGCKKKKLKVIQVPTGPDIYFEDELDPGVGGTYLANLKNSFSAAVSEEYFLNPTFHNLEIKENFEYYEDSAAANTTKSTAIYDPVLKITYIYQKAKMDDAEESKGSGLFIVIKNQTTTTLADTPPTLPNINERVYVGINIKAYGASLYVTQAVIADSTKINWTYDFIIDSRERSIEDMWLKNAQDNRVDALTIKNSARVIEDNYLLIYVFNKALSSSRAVYKIFNTAYYIGIEYREAGKEVFTPYSSDDIQKGNMLLSPDDINWNDMHFMGYSTRYSGGVNTPVKMIIYDERE